MHVSLAIQNYTKIETSWWLHICMLFLSFLTMEFLILWLTCTFQLIYCKKSVLNLTWRQAIFLVIIFYFYLYAALHFTKIIFSPV